VVIYLADLLPLLVTVILVSIVIVIVRAASRNHHQRVHRAIIEVREKAEMEKARAEIKELYRKAREEVDRVGP
jgi:cell division protein FtsL